MMSTGKVRRENVHKIITAKKTKRCKQTLRLPLKHEDLQPYFIGGPVVGLHVSDNKRFLFPKEQYKGMIVALLRLPRDLTGVPLYLYPCHLET
jgi:hypothetical protein